MRQIVSAAELMSFDKDDVIIFDVSSGSESRYNRNHLERALYINLERHLASVGDYSLGGRHPLPIINEFIRVLEGFGVTNETHLVLYDDKNGSNAAAIGHAKVQVLNGGFKAAMEAGYRTTSIIEVPSPSKYLTKLEWQLPTATLSEVNIVRTHKVNTNFHHS
jgi:thiosulfate/3-mercaptopyruvate sulfurtransferase